MIGIGYIYIYRKRIYNLEELHIYYEKLLYIFYVLGYEIFSFNNLMDSSNSSRLAYRSRRSLEVVEFSGAHDAVAGCNFTDGLACHERCRVALRGCLHRSGF